MLWYTSCKDSALIAINLETGAETKRYQLTGKPIDMCWNRWLFWYNDFANKQIRTVQPGEY